MAYRDKDCPCASGVYSSDAREILAAVHAQNLASLNAAALRDRYRRVNGIADKPQTFDLSPLPLFGDAHKQKDLF